MTAPLPTPDPHDTRSEMRETRVTRATPAMIEAAARVMADEAAIAWGALAYADTSWACVRGEWIARVAPILTAAEAARPWPDPRDVALTTIVELCEDDEGPHCDGKGVRAYEIREAIADAGVTL